MGRKKDKEHKDKQVKSVLNKEDNDKISNNFEKLTFSERRDRVLVVTTIIAAVIVILNKALVLVQKSMNQFYVNKDTIFGYKEGFFSPIQFISVFLFTALLFILYKFFIYCYYELKNLSNKTIELKDEQKTNKKYIDVFDSAIRCFIMFMMFLIGILLIFELKNDIKILFGVVALISTIILLFGKSVIKIVEQNFMKFICDGLLFTIVYISVFYISYGLIFNGNLTINFKDQNVEILFSGNDIPKEVNLSVFNDGVLNFENSYNLENDFLNSYMECMDYTDDSKKEDKQTSLSKNKYYYKIKIDLSQHYKQGKNSILFKIDVHGKSFKIRNDLIFNNYNYEYTNDELGIQY